MTSDLVHLYNLLGKLRRQVGGDRTLAASTGRMGWPDRGVYFFFEPGEDRPDGSPRVVRVGTHALTASSKTTLWNRLSQHRGYVGGRWVGGGNHRGSVFRRHVGAALLRRDGGPEDVAATWGKGSSAPEPVRRTEHPHEQLVSEVIGAMPVLWLPVEDLPGPASDRALIEAGTISLLSQQSNPDADPPSDGWLGHCSDRESIRASGLWNVQHVSGPPPTGCLRAFQVWLSELSSP